MWPQNMNNGLVGIFSPSEPLGGDRMMRMKASLKTLDDAGVRYRFAKNAMNVSPFTSAGSIGERIEDINELLDDDDVGILLGSWGGKAANQLMPHLPYAKFAEKKKPVLGFSDVAVLLNAITAKTGLITFHGPNVAGKLKESDFGNLKQFTAAYDWQAENFLNLAPNTVLKNGKSTGKLFGGNLNCFVLGLLTANIDLSTFDGGIFFFEDLGLSPRLLEQYLFAIRNSGLLERISGIVVGQIDAPPEVGWMKVNSIDVLQSALDDFQGPIVYSQFFGHSVLPKPALPIGAIATLDTSSETLRIKE